MRPVLSCTVTIFQVINNTTPDFDSDQSVVFSLVSRVTYGFRVFLTFSRPGITGKRKKAEFAFLMLGILECNLIKMVNIPWSGVKYIHTKTMLITENIPSSLRNGGC